MEKLTVEDLMTSEVIKVSPSDDLASLHDLMMDHHIRHIPVVDKDDCVVGLVSHRDLAGVALMTGQTLPVTELQQLLRATKVREIMVTGVETVEPDEDAEEAGRLMLSTKYGCLPVTENGKLVGIITEGDFVRYVVESESGLEARRQLANRIAL